MKQSSEVDRILELERENRALREAVNRLLRCPAIADENHNDPEWGCEETAEAEAFARAVLHTGGQDQ